MTEEIKKTIDKEANWLSTDGHGAVNEITRHNFKLGAEYGYSLSAKELEEKDREVERLKKLIEEQFKACHDIDSFDRRWKTYKKQNNL